MAAIRAAVAPVLNMAFVLRCCDTAVPRTMRLTARNPHVTVATLTFATLAAGLYGPLMRSSCATTACTTPFGGRYG
jgi:hypothetical protein